MSPSFLPIDSRKHVHKGPGNVLEFSPAAVDITLIDRRGRTIWQQKRLPETGPLVWEGKDQKGHKVEIGSYILKIIYPDIVPVYVPFIVM